MANKSTDIDLWYKYKQTKAVSDRAALLAQLDGIIQSYVNKWAGPVPRDVLLSEARGLALKAFDTFDPSRNVLLSTHVTNNLAPISRIVYSHQNTIRIPENILMKINGYLAAKDHLVTLYGRDPTTDELHQHTGHTAKDIAKFDKALTHNLIESGGTVTGDFYRTDDDVDNDLLSAIYFDLTPDEKLLFESLTGHFHKQKLTTPEILTKLNINQSQLSYKKTLLNAKIHRLLDGFNRI